MLNGTGSDTVAVVLGGGANQETGSDILAEALRGIMGLGGDAGVARDPAGNLTASREISVTTEAAGISLALRGMDQRGPSLRDGVTRDRRRLFAPGAREIVVGETLVHQVPGFAVGQVVRLGALEWTITGQFSAGGSAFGSEVWADLDVVRSAFDRQGEVQSLRLRLNDLAGITSLQQALATLAVVTLNALPEVDLHAAQSGRTADLIRMFGWPSALLMAVGAAAGH